MSYVNGIAIDNLISGFGDSHKCQLMAIQFCSSLRQGFRLALESLWRHKVISHLDKFNHTTLLTNHEINLFATPCKFISNE